MNRRQEIRIARALRACADRKDLNGLPLAPDWVWALLVEVASALEDHDAGAWGSKKKEAKRGE